ncbi:titin isoform X3 [Octopus sinensis]|uniref:Titin isoform X3 n=1 Tax=Octopus sinensis TaxID=2607531 RepID=A0A7E6EQU7_9MOLL|nr:titin isoform X3 [Octopus sinensis]
MRKPEDHDEYYDVPAGEVLPDTKVTKPTGPFGVYHVDLPVDLEQLHRVDPPSRPVSSQDIDKSLTQADIPTTQDFPEGIEHTIGEYRTTPVDVFPGQDHQLPVEPLSRKDIPVVESSLDQIHQQVPIPTDRNVRRSVGGGVYHVDQPVALETLHRVEKPSFQSGEYPIDQSVDSIEPDDANISYSQQIPSDQDYNIGKLSAPDIPYVEMRKPEDHDEYYDVPAGEVLPDTKVTKPTGPFGVYHVDLPVDLEQLHRVDPPSRPVSSQDIDKSLTQADIPTTQDFPEGIEHTIGEYRTTPVDVVPGQDHDLPVEPLSRKDIPVVESSVDQIHQQVPIPTDRNVRRSVGGGVYHVDQPVALETLHRVEKPSFQSGEYPIDQSVDSIEPVDANIAYSQQIPSDQDYNIGKLSAPDIPHVEMRKPEDHDEYYDVPTGEVLPDTKVTKPTGPFGVYHVDLPVDLEQLHRVDPPSRPVSSQDIDKSLTQADIPTTQDFPEGIEHTIGEYRTTPVDVVPGQDHDLPVEPLSRKDIPVVESSVDQIHQQVPIPTDQNVRRSVGGGVYHVDQPVALETLHRVEKPSFQSGEYPINQSVDSIEPVETNISYSQQIPSDQDYNIGKLSAPDIPHVEMRKPEDHDEYYDVPTGEVLPDSKVTKPTGPFGVYHVDLPMDLEQLRRVDPPSRPVSSQDIDKSLTQADIPTTQDFPEGIVHTIGEYRTTPVDIVPGQDHQLPVEPLSRKDIPVVESSVDQIHQQVPIPTDRNVRRSVGGGVYHVDQPVALETLHRVEKPSFQSGEFPINQSVDSIEPVETNISYSQQIPSDQDYNIGKLSAPDIPHVEMRKPEDHDEYYDVPTGEVLPDTKVTKPTGSFGVYHVDLPVDLEQLHRVDPPSRPVSSQDIDKSLTQADIRSTQDFPEGIEHTIGEYRTTPVYVFPGQDHQLPVEPLSRKDIHVVEPSVGYIGQQVPIPTDQNIRRSVGGSVYPVDHPVIPGTLHYVDREYPVGQSADTTETGDVTLLHGRQLLPDQDYNIEILSPQDIPQVQMSKTKDNFQYHDLPASKQLQSIDVAKPSGPFGVYHVDLPVDLEQLHRAAKPSSQGGSQPVDKPAGNADVTTRHDTPEIIGQSIGEYHTTPDLPTSQGQLPTKQDDHIIKQPIAPGVQYNKISTQDTDAVHIPTDQYGQPISPFTAQDDHGNRLSIGAGVYHVDVPSNLEQLHRVDQHSQLRPTSDIDQPTHQDVQGNIGLRAGQDVENNVVIPAPEGIRSVTVVSTPGIHHMSSQIVDMQSPVTSSDLKFPLAQEQYTGEGIPVPTSRDQLKKADIHIGEGQELSSIEQLTDKGSSSVDPRGFALPSNKGNTYIGGLPVHADLPTSQEDHRDGLSTNRPSFHSDTPTGGSRLHHVDLSTGQDSCKPIDLSVDQDPLVDNFPADQYCYYVDPPITEKISLAHETTDLSTNKHIPLHSFHLSTGQDVHQHLPLQAHQVELHHDDSRTEDGNQDTNKIVGVHCDKVSAGGQILTTVLTSDSDVGHLQEEDHNVDGSVSSDGAVPSIQAQVQNLNVTSCQGQLKKDDLSSGQDKFKSVQNTGQHRDDHECRYGLKHTDQHGDDHECRYGLKHTDQHGDDHECRYGLKHTDQHGDDHECRYGLKHSDQHGDDHECRYGLKHSDQHGDDHECRYGLKHTDQHGDDHECRYGLKHTDQHGDDHECRYGLKHTDQHGDDHECRYGLKHTDQHGDDHECRYGLKHTDQHGDDHECRYGLKHTDQHGDDHECRYGLKHTDQHGDDHECRYGLKHSDQHGDDHEYGLKHTDQHGDDRECRYGLKDSEQRQDDFQCQYSIKYIDQHRDNKECEYSLRHTDQGNVFECQYDLEHSDQYRDDQYCFYINPPVTEQIFLAPQTADPSVSKHVPLHCFHLSTGQDVQQHIPLQSHQVDLRHADSQTGENGNQVGDKTVDIHCNKVSTGGQILTTVLTSDSDAGHLQEEGGIVSVVQTHVQKNPTSEGAQSQKDDLSTGQGQSKLVQGTEQQGTEYSFGQGLQQSSSTECKYTFEHTGQSGESSSYNIEQTHITHSFPKSDELSGHQQGDVSILHLSTQQPDAPSSSRSQSSTTQQGDISYSTHISSQSTSDQDTLQFQDSRTPTVLSDPTKEVTTKKSSRKSRKSNRKKKKTSSQARLAVAGKTPTITITEDSSSPHHDDDDEESDDYLRFIEKHQQKMQQQQQQAAAAVDKAGQEPTTTTTTTVSSEGHGEESDDESEGKTRSVASIIQMFEQTSDTALQSSATDIVREVQKSAQATLRKESQEFVKQDSSEWVVIDDSDLDGFDAEKVPSANGTYVETEDSAPKVEEWVKVSAVKEKFEDKIKNGSMSEKTIIREATKVHTSTLAKHKSSEKADDVDQPYGVPEPPDAHFKTPSDDENLEFSEKLKMFTGKHAQNYYVTTQPDELLSSDEETPDTTSKGSERSYQTASETSEIRSETVKVSSTGEQKSEVVEERRESTSSLIAKFEEATTREKPSKKEAMSFDKDSKETVQKEVTKSWKTDSSQSAVQEIKESHVFQEKKESISSEGETPDLKEFPKESKETVSSVEKSFKTETTEMKQKVEYSVDDGKVKEIFTSEDSQILSSKTLDKTISSLDKDISPELKDKSPSPEPQLKSRLHEAKEKTPSPEPQLKSPSPEPQLKTPSPEPKEKTPSPEPKEKTPSPEPKEKSPSPKPKDKSPSPLQLKSKSPSPEPKEKTPSPPHMKSKSPSPPHLKSKSPSPEPKDKSPSPSHLKSKSPSPELKDKTPSPKLQLKSSSPKPKDKSPSPPHLKSKSPSPPHLKSKSPSPEPKDKSPSPLQLKSKSPSPEVKDKSPSPLHFKSKSPSPDLKEKSPSPPHLKSKSPSPSHLKSKSPSPEPKDKSPSPLQLKSKSPSPEPKDKSPSPLQLKSKSPSPELKDKSPSPLQLKSKSPSPELKDKSPSPLQLKSKSPSPEPKDKSPSPLRLKSKSPSPEPKEKTPSPLRLKSKSPSPEPKDKSLSPLHLKSKSPSPELKEKTPSPLRLKSKSPSPEPKSKTPSPLQQKSKSPSPELKDKAPSPLHLKSKSPSPEIKEKTPSPPHLKSKSPSPELKDKPPSPPHLKSKLPSPPHLKSKSPSPEPKGKTPSPEPKEKTPSPPHIKSKSPSPEPKAKSPSPPRLKSKSPSPEPKEKILSSKPQLKSPSPEPQLKASSPEPQASEICPKPYDEEDFEIIEQEEILEAKISIERQTPFEPAAIDLSSTDKVCPPKEHGAEPPDDGLQTQLEEEPHKDTDYEISRREVFLEKESRSFYTSKPEPSKDIISSKFADKDVHTIVSTTSVKEVSTTISEHTTKVIEDEDKESTTISSEKDFLSKNEMRSPVCDDVQESKVVESVPADSVEVSPVEQKITRKSSSGELFEISRQEEKMIIDSPEKLEIHEWQTPAPEATERFDRQAESMSDESLVEVQLDALKEDIREKVLEETQERAVKRLQQLQDVSDEESDEIFTHTDQRTKEEFTERSYEDSKKKVSSTESPGLSPTADHLKKDLGDRTEITYEFPVQEDLSSDEGSKGSSLEMFLTHEKSCQEEEEEEKYTSPKDQTSVTHEQRISTVTSEYKTSSTSEMIEESISKEEKSVYSSKISQEYRVEDEQDMTSDEETSEEIQETDTSKKTAPQFSSILSEEATYFEISRQEQFMTVASPEKIEYKTPAKSDGLSFSADPFLVSSALAHETSVESIRSIPKAESPLTEQSPKHVAKDDTSDRTEEKYSVDLAALQAESDAKFKETSPHDFQEEKYLSSDDESDDDDHDDVDIMTEMDYMSKSQSIDVTDEMEKRSEDITDSGFKSGADDDLSRRSTDKDQVDFTKSFPFQTSEEQLVKEEISNKEVRNESFKQETRVQETTVHEGSIEERKVLDDITPSKFTSESKIIEDVKVKRSETATTEESTTRSTTVGDEIQSIKDETRSVKQKDVESESKREQATVEDEFQKETTEELTTKDALKMHSELTEGKSQTFEEDGTKIEISQEKSSVCDKSFEEEIGKQQYEKESKDGEIQKIEDLEQKLTEKDSKLEIVTDTVSREDDFQKEIKKEVAVKDESKLSMTITDDLMEIDKTDKKFKSQTSEIEENVQHEDTFHKEVVELKEPETARVLEVIEGEDSGGESDHSFIEHSDEENEQMEALTRSGHLMTSTRMEDLVEEEVDETEAEDQFIDRREYFEHQQRDTIDFRIVQRNGGPDFNATDRFPPLHPDKDVTSVRKGTLKDSDIPSKSQQPVQPQEDQIPFLGKQETVQEITDTKTSTLTNEKSTIGQSTGLFPSESLKETEKVSHKIATDKVNFTEDFTSYNSHITDDYTNYSSDFSSYHRDGSGLGARNILVPSSSTEAQERSATPSASDDDDSSGEYYSTERIKKLRAIDQMTESIEYPLKDKTDKDSNGRPLSPTEYTLMTESQLELHEALQSVVDDQDIMTQSMIESHESLTQSMIDPMTQSQIGEEFRRSLDSQSDIDSRMSIELSREAELEQEESDLKKDEERPPSPSEFTLLTSLEQEELAKALGLQDNGLTAVEIEDEYESVDKDRDETSQQLAQQPSAPTRDDQFTADADLKGIDKQEIIFEQMVEQIVCEGNKISMPDSTLQDEDSVSTEPALMSSSQSRDNNTYSSISSSDFGEQVAAVQSQQPCREDSGSDDRALTEEDFERMMSSYENVYDGVQLAPEVSKLAMNASDLDIGDRFDTKQLDLHLQPTGRSSSYEQLYKETGEEIAETSEQAEQVVYSAESKEDMPRTDQHDVQRELITAAKDEEEKEEEEEENLSSSSSEVAQVEDVDFLPDAEMRDTSEEKTEETDVEEQFSPLPKSSPASKGALDLRLEDKFFSFTQSPVESPTAEIANEISPAQDLLDVKDMQITVGLSPSEINAKSKLGSLSEFYETKTTEDFKTMSKIIASKTPRVEYEKDSGESFNIPRISTDSDTTEERLELDNVTEQSATSLMSEEHDGTEDDYKRETPEERAERLSSMAFDNMGFAGEDVVDSEIKTHSDDFSEESPSLAAKEISPEDLEEKSHQFDFPAVHQEIWQMGIQALGKTKLSEENEMFSSSMKFEEVTHKVSFEKDDDEESGAAMYSESEETSRSESGDTKDQNSFQESIQRSKTSDGQFEATSEIRTEKTIVTSSRAQVSLSESQSKMITETKVYQAKEPSEGIELTGHDATEKTARHLTTTASEPIISHPFDQSTVETISPEASSSDSEGFYDKESGKKLPWETVHHFSRQFSDNYLEQQEKQGIVTVQSVDMGVFYRRSSKDYSNITFSEQDISESIAEEEEEPPKRVTFTLSEDLEEFPSEVATGSDESKHDDEVEQEIRKPDDIFDESVKDQIVVKTIKKQPTALSKTEEPVVTTSKTEEPVVTTSKTEEPVVTTSRTEEPVVTTSKTEEPVVTTSKTEEPVVTTSKTEEPVVTTSKTEEPVVTTSKTEESIITTSKTEEPIVTTSKTEKSVFSTFKTEEHVTSSKGEEPVITTVKTEHITTTYKTGEPVITTSKKEESVIKTSKTEEPVITTSRTEDITIASEAEEPAFVTSKTEHVTTSTTEEPVVTTSKTEEYVTSTTEEPVVTTSKTEEYVTSTTEEPVITTSKTEEYVTTSTTEEPVIITSKTEERIITSTTKEPVVTTFKSEEHVKTSKTEECVITTSKAEEPVSTTMTEEHVTTKSESEEPVVTTTRTERIITTSKIGEPVITTSKTEHVTTTSKTGEPDVTTTKTEEFFTTTSEPGEPVITTSETGEPVVTTSKTEERVITTSKREEPVIRTSKTEHFTVDPKDKFDIPTAKTDHVTTTTKSAHVTVTSTVEHVIKTSKKKDDIEEAEEESIVEAKKDILEPYDRMSGEYEATVLANIMDDHSSKQEKAPESPDELSREDTLKEKDLEYEMVSKSAGDLASPSESKSSDLSLDLSSEKLPSKDDLDEEHQLRPKPDSEEVSPKSGIIGVVSIESRMAQKELLQESADEKDRSLSPSVDSDELSTTYESQAELQEELWSEIPPVDRYPAPARRKHYADGESSEAEKESPEIELSPIAEAPASKTDSEEQEESKMTAQDRRVTFLSEESKEKLRQSISNEDLVKTSTSSSEVSNEPTLLAASYDLDSGHVSHIVTAYDMSPDTIESQVPHPPAPKAILSSPEDDVFEVEPTVGTTRTDEPCTEPDSEKSYTGPQSEVIIIEDICVSKDKTGSESTESLPPTPAPTPKDATTIKDTVCNLQDAANKLQTEGLFDRQFGSVSSETSEKRPSSFEKDFSKDESSDDDDDHGQSFEMVSPTEIIGYDQYAAKYLQGGIAGCIETASLTASVESLSTSGSSFADLRASEPTSMKSSLEEFASATAFVEPSAPPMEEVCKIPSSHTMKPDTDSSPDQSLFSSSDASEKGAATMDIVASSVASPGACRPDLLPSDSFQKSLSTEEISETENIEDIAADRISQLPNGPTEVDFQPDIDSVSSTVKTVVPAAPPDLVQSSPSYVMEEEKSQQEDVAMELEDNQISAGSDAAVRDVMTDSLIEDVKLSAEQQEVLVTSDQTLYELEMPMEEEASPIEQVGPTSATVSITETTSSVVVKTEAPTVEFHEEQREIYPAEMVESRSPTEIVGLEPVLDDLEEQPYELKKDEIYPGKRALEFDVSSYETLLEESKERQQEGETSVVEVSHLIREDQRINLDDTDEETVQFSDQLKSDHDVSFVHTSEKVCTDMVEEEFSDLSKDASYEQVELAESSLEFAEKAEEELEALAGKTPEISFEPSKGEQDLDRPISPTPQDSQEGVLSDDYEKVSASISTEELEKTATVFVDSVLEEASKVQEKAQVFPEQTEAEKPIDETTFDDSKESEKMVAFSFSEQFDPSMMCRSQPAFFSAPPPPSHPPPFTKQRDDDMPEITITEHLHKSIDKDDFVPSGFVPSHMPDSSSEQEDKESDEKESGDDSPKGEGMSYFEMIQDEMEFESEETEKNGVSSHEPSSSAFVIADAHAGSAKTFTSEQELEWNVQKFSETPDKVPTTSSFEDSFSLQTKTEPVPISSSKQFQRDSETKDSSKNGFLGFEPSVMHATDILSPEDIADTSSVDSFTTVVGVDQEGDECDDDRLADVASMTSSIHSDIYSMHTEPEEEEPYDWPLLTEEDKSGESSPCSDRFEMIGKTALSVISEKSDEDRFEMIEKDELEALSDSHSSSKTSPEMISASPGTVGHTHGYPNIRYAGRSREKDDGSAASSVSSSLLEFERLEGEIGQFGSLGSNEAHSLPSSFDSRNFHWRAADRDDVSVASSLGEFERLERQIALGGSIGSFSSIDKLMPSGQGSATNGSMSSLAEFENLEKECTGGGYSSSGDDRHSSSSGHSKRSASSSLAEFERLEQEIVISEELAAEAKKIASILESGELPEYPESESLGSSYQSNGHMRDVPEIIGNFDIEQDSIDGDDIDKDSLSSEEPKMQDVSQVAKEEEDDIDSLDGDSKDELTSSVIFVSNAEIQDSSEMGQFDFDRDSLQGDDTAMQFSVESLQLDQDASFDMHSSVDSLEIKDKFSRDMQSSADSLELKERMSKEMVDSTDSLEFKDTVKDTDKFETDSLVDQDDIMQTSSDSLDAFPALTHQNIMEASLESARWSLSSSYFSHSSQETLRSESHSDSSHSRDVMQMSAESVDFDKDRRFESSDTEMDYKTVSSKTLTSSALDPEIRMITGISHPNNPFLDNEGNVRTDLGYPGHFRNKYEYSKFDKEGNYRWNTEFEETTRNNSYLNWGPYQEKKKVYTMTEWEAMRNAKKRSADNEELGGDSEQVSVIPDNHFAQLNNKEVSSNLPSEHTTSHPRTSSPPPSTVLRPSSPVSSTTATTTTTTTTTTYYSSSNSSSSSSSTYHAAVTRPDSSSTSQTAATSDPLLYHHKHTDLPQQMSTEESQSKTEDRRDSDVAPDAETEDSAQATSLMMKKEIHKKTYMRDGREETFIQEESRVEQQNETPEELRESMQQIIDQFMQTPSEFDQRQCLEDDV